ncbi:MAG: DUF4430 domain-containing protein [Oscillospiraceae bacterium]|nr:DUF4430 domain-containing protein [Oscillospiraceae bacterium]
MKKKHLANMIMVALIAVMVAGGVVTALLLRQPTTATQPQGTAATYLETGGGSGFCTVQIRCDTILSNMDRLPAEKAPFVPAGGQILAQTQVAFSEGDTAFDVLKKICEAADIQLEYSWTPLYDSYYVESINHLYEFDCGPESGWMYQINGQTPNYGSSSYEVRDGDTVVWAYSCDGQGKDLG